MRRGRRSERDVHTAAGNPPRSGPVLGAIRTDLVLWLGAAPALETGAVVTIHEDRSRIRILPLVPGHTGRR
jgi:hypothetical protein